MKPDLKQLCPHCGSSEVFDRIGAAPWRGISSAQSESVRSAALIAMPVSFVLSARTTQRRVIIERPNEPVFA